MIALELIRDHWPILLLAAVSLWFFTGRVIPTDGQRNDEATCRARAQRAEEYRRLRRMELPR